MLHTSSQLIDRIRQGALLFCIGMLLAGCRGTTTAVPPTNAPVDATATLPAVAATTAAPPTLTPTAEPLAVRVNGEGIALAEFEAELRQVQEAHQMAGMTVTEEDQRQQALDNLIDQALLAQAAFENGYELDESGLQAEMDQLAQSLAAKTGSGQALQDWMAKYGYSEPAFRSALQRSLAAAWQRDQIAAAVPATAEQVRARQILTQNEDIANRALEIVRQPGINFASYAAQYDPQTSGDLGWFPRGYLTQAEVEEAAFKLQPGEISPVIHTEIGYHIVQVISREPSRAISPDALRVLQHKALQDWLAARREAGQIETVLP